jgi:hypothetical protein
MNKLDRLVYVPNRLSGLCLFDGEATISQEAFEVIGERGVTEIRNKIFEVIMHKKAIFGNASLDYFGLYHEQLFYDLTTRTLLKVNQSQDHTYGSIKRPNVDYHVSKHLYDGEVLKYRKLRDVTAKNIIRGGHVITEDFFSPDR